MRIIFARTCIKDANRLMCETRAFCEFSQPSAARHGNQMAVDLLCYTCWFDKEVLSNVHSEGTRNLFCL